MLVLLLQMENQRLYAIIDRLNTRGSDNASETASQLSDLSSYAPREVSMFTPSHLPPPRCSSRGVVLFTPLFPEGNSNTKKTASQLSALSSYAAS